VKHRHKHNKSNEFKEELCEQDKQYKKTLHLRMKIKHRKKIEQEVKNNYGHQSWRKWENLTLREIDKTT
jgi:hypothetical protein